MRSQRPARLRNAYPGRSADSRPPAHDPATRSRTRQSDAQAAGPAIPKSRLIRHEKPALSFANAAKTVICRDRVQTDPAIRRTAHHPRTDFVRTESPHAGKTVRPLSRPASARRLENTPPDRLPTNRAPATLHSTKAPTAGNAGPRLPPKTSADDRTPAAARQKRFFNSESLDHARPTAGDAGPRLPPPKTSADDRARPDGQKRKKGIPSERDTLGLLCGDAPIRPSRRQPARRFRPLRRGIRPAAPRAPSANRARAPARPWHRPAPGCPNCPCP